MAKFLMQETILQGDVQTARLGAGNGSANYVDDKEVGKALKLAGESRYNLCVAGDPIEAFVKSLESATLDDFSIGSIQVGGRKEVTFDGLQATPGVGVVAVGDYVVTGTAVAKGTALTEALRVTKATDQPFAVITVAADANDDSVEVTASLATLANQLKNARFGWRVVSLGSVGTGAVGTVGVIERVRA